MARTGLLFVLLAVGLAPGRMRAADFPVQGVTMPLTDVSAAVEVRFRSLRLNRAEDVWNVEVSLFNTGTDPLPTPLIAVAESWTGTSGPLEVDQAADPGRHGPFWNLTPQVPGAALAPGTASVARTLALGRLGNATPKLRLRVYARSASGGGPVYGLVRVLDGAGLPLGGGTVVQEGPGGRREMAVDADAAVATVGGEAGRYLWRFDGPGTNHFPVWRRVVLPGAPQSTVTLLESPRLTLRAANGAMVGEAAATLGASDGTVELRFDAGTFAGPTRVTLTPVMTQALPFALPGGWSPWVAFWWEAGAAPRRPVAAQLRLGTTLPAGRRALWLQFDPVTAGWRVVQAVRSPATGTVGLPCPTSGAFVYAIADTDSTEPLNPVAGEVLNNDALSTGIGTNLVAVGRVVPPVAAASLEPSLVTARAEVTVTRRDGPIASGTPVVAEIEETYRLRNGEVRVLPRYETSLSLYRAPGDTNASQAHAEFPLRPQWLLAGDRLLEATVKVDIAVPGAFAGGVLQPGGELDLEGVRLRAPVGVLASPQAVRVRARPPATGAALRFDLEVPGVMAGRGLEIDFVPPLADGNYVLARTVDSGGVIGWQPMERLGISRGVVTSQEPAVGNRLPGLHRSGAYAMVPVSARQGLVDGQLRPASAADGAAFRIEGQPWLSVVGPDGAFRILAPAGAGILTARNHATLEDARQEFIMPATLVVAPLNLQLGNQPPRVAAVTPGDLATNVPVLAPIAIVFTEPLAPGSVGADAVQLRTEAGALIPASLRREDSGTELRLYPSNALAGATRHVVTLAPTLADVAGMRLAGPTRFEFTTVGQPAVQRPGAQLYAEAPGTNGLARVVGTAGLAQPRQTVIFVNDTTGQTSTRVAAADGSFTHAIPAAEEDRLRIVLVNTDGSRTELPVGRQVFPDGSVAFYSGGGSFEVDGGTNEVRGVTVEVPPGATLGRTKLKVEIRPLGEIAEIVRRTPLDGGNGVPLGGLRFTVEGDPLRVPARWRLRFDPEALESQLAKAAGTNPPILLAAAPQEVVEATAAGPVPVSAYRYLGTLEGVDGVSGVASARNRARPQNVPANWILESGASGTVDAMLFGVQIWPKYEAFGKVVSAILTDGTSAVVGTEVPLGGAVVRARQSAGNQIPNSLVSGDLFATSADDGTFALLLPARYERANPPILGGYALVATHPAFPRQFASSRTPAQITPAYPFGSGHLVFDRQRPPDTTPPAISVIQTPSTPQAGEAVLLRIETTDNSTTVGPTVRLGTVDPPAARAVLTSAGPGVWRLTCDQPAQVLVRASAVDGFLNASERVHAVTFGLPLPQGPLVNDPLGPYVVYTQPDQLAVGVPTAAAFTLNFNERLDPAVLAQPWVYFTLNPPAGLPRASFGRDPRELVVSFPALATDTAYTLTVQNVRDSNGQILDQNPDTNSPPAEPFLLRFRTAPAVQADLPGIIEGGGVLVRGSLAYVLDRTIAGEPSAFRIFDVSVPSRPRERRTLYLPGPMRSIALVPNYQYALGFAPPGTPGPTPGIVRRSDLIVAGGMVSGSTLLSIYDPDELLEESPLGLEAVGLVNTRLNLDETALVTRVAWSAPYLVAVENAAAAPAVRVYNLQAMLLGPAYRRQDPVVLDSLPVASTNGRDANGDGDFVDPLDELPSLGRDRFNFATGEVDVFTLAPPPPPTNAAIQTVVERTSRFVTDAVIDGPSGFVGVLATGGSDTRIHTFRGRPFETNQMLLPASFRGYAVGQLIGEGNRVDFPGYYPKRAVLVNQGLRRLAVIALISEDVRTNRLVVIDCSRPAGIGLVNEIPFDRSTFGLLQGAEAAGSDHVLLSTVSEATGTARENLVALDVRRLLDPAPARGVHPAIVGSLPSAGAGITPFVSLPSGLTAVSLRNVNRVTQASPAIRLVPADGTWTDLFRAGDLNDRAQEWTRVSEYELLPVASLGTNSALIPGLASAHFQIVAEVPGGAGSEISLAALSLDGAGRPIARAAAAQPPAILERIPLRRLSDFINRPGYNVYVSSPIALVPQDLTPAELNTVQAHHRRHVMLAGEKFRVGISETMQRNPVLGPFAGTGQVQHAADTNLPPVRLGASVTRPVMDFRFDADDFARLATTLDWVNTNQCPGYVRLHFVSSHDCEVSLTLDGQPARSIADETGAVHAQVTRLPMSAGVHHFLLDALQVGAPGRHRFEIKGENFVGLAGVPAVVEPGEIEHEVTIQHAFPVGHTIIQGVDLWDGHLAYSRQDVRFPGRELDLEFSRSYSSAGNSSDGPLGAGWTHNHHVRVIADTCGRWTVSGGDGSGNSFTLPAANPILAARYAHLLPSPNAVGRYEFFRPQIGYHSVLVRDTGRPTELWFFTKSAVRYAFAVEPAAIEGQNTVYTLREIREPNGNRLRYDYLDNDIDPTTLDTVTELDAIGGLPKRGFRFEYVDVTGEARIRRLIGFNHQGSPDLLGLELRFEYDTVGNLTSCTRAEPDGSRRTESYGYTPEPSGPFAYNLTAVTNANGNVTRYAYFPAGVAGYYAAGRPIDGVASHEVVQTVTRVGTAQGEFAGTASAVTRFTYDWTNFRRTVSDPRGTDGLGQPVPATVYTLNSYGATTRIEAPLGQITEMRWATDHLDGSVTDAAGTPVRDVLMTYRRDAEGLETHYEFRDGRGNPTGERVVPSPNKAAIRDAAGQVAAALETQSAYDALFNQRTNHLDAEGSVTRTQLDPLTGNVRRVIDAEGYSVELDYFPNGDLRQRRDPRGFRTLYENYDPYGNAGTVRAEVELGGRTVTTTSVFDERGRRREVTDTYGHRETIEYDGLDRTIRTTRHQMPGSNTGPDSTVRRSYYPGGAVRFSVNPLGLTNRVRYDALERAVGSEFPGVRQVDGSVTNYTSTIGYDAAGNVVTETDPRGVVRQHASDALNRRVRTLVSGPHGPVALTVSNRFDRVGNVTNTTDLYGFTTRFEHDGLYRLVATYLPIASGIVRSQPDRTGTIRSRTDANGNVTTNEYDRLYRLIRSTDPVGNLRTNGYDAAGNRVVEQDLSTGRRSEMVYDGLNRVVRVRQTGPGLPPAGYVTATQYDDSLHETEVTNPRGFKTRTRRDALDRVAFTVVDVDGLRLETRYAYDAAGNVRTVQDPQNGDVDVTHDYDGLSRRIRSTYVTTPSDLGVPVLEETWYDGGGNVVGNRDRRGLERRFSFDNLGRPLVTELREDLSNGGAWLRMSEIEYDDAANTVRTFDARRQRTTTENDPLGRPLVIIDALGQVSRYTYDAVNRRSETDRRQQRTEFSYDGLNRLRMTLERDAAGVVRTRLETFYLDAQRQHLIVDRRGLTNRMQFDALGRLVRTERSGGNTAALYGSDPLVLEQRAYDGNGNLVLATDANGNQVQHQYDGADRRTATVEGFGSPVAATTTFQYDRVGNLLESKDGRAHGVAFDVKHTYDARYRRVATANALGETSRFTYDPANHRVSHVDPKGGTTKYAYDEVDALVQVDETSRGSGPGTAGITRFRYDANRNRLAQQDASGNLVTYAYDAVNRLTNTLQHLTVPPAIATGSHAPVPAPGATLSWVTGYDANGNANFLLDPRGQVVRMQHDHLDRLVLREYANHAEKDGNGSPIDFQPLKIEYAYDGNGNRTRCVETKRLGAVSVTETTESTYDTLDRLRTQKRIDHDLPAGKTQTFAYDAAGNRTSVTDPDSRVSLFRFDARNRLAQVTLDPGPAALDATYVWEPDNLLQKLELPGGASSLRTYDPADRVVGIDNLGAGAAVHSTYAYAYDANGNRVKQVESQPVLGAGPETTHYRYDPLDRLTNVVYGVANLTYTYAANGNRLTESGTDGAGNPVNRLWLYTAQPARPATTFSGVNTLARIQDLTPAAAHIDYDYDANLNQVARTQGSVTTRFRFDIRDQMIEAQTAGGTTRFDYNGDRLRAKKLTTAAGPGVLPETRYLYDQRAVLLEYGGAATGHATIHKYDYGMALLALGTPAGAPAGLDRQFYQHDGLGSTANLVNPAGGLAHSYRYDPWGRLRGEAGVSSNRRQYTGHYRDVETGLHYFGARYYDDEQARFLSQDPYLGEAGTPPSLHRYLYAYANPVKWVDLTGYENMPPPQGVYWTWDDVPVGVTVATYQSKYQTFYVAVDAKHYRGDTPAAREASKKFAIEIWAEGHGTLTPGRGTKNAPSFWREVANTLLPKQLEKHQSPPNVVQEDSHTPTGRLEKFKKDHEVAKRDLAESAARVAVNVVADKLDNNVITKAAHARDRADPESTNQPFQDQTRREMLDKAYDLAKDGAGAAIDYVEDGVINLVTGGAKWLKDAAKLNSNALKRLINAGEDVAEKKEQFDAVVDQGKDFIDVIKEAPKPKTTEEEQESFWQKVVNLFKRAADLDSDEEPSPNPDPKDRARQLDRRVDGKRTGSKP